MTSALTRKLIASKARQTATQSNRSKDSSVLAQSDFAIVEFDEALIDPVASIMPSPDFAAHELSCDCSARDEHCPKVPHGCPAGLISGAQCFGDFVVICLHGKEAI